MSILIVGKLTKARKIILNNMMMMIVPINIMMMMTTAAHPGGELQNIGQLFPAAQTVHHRFFPFSWIKFFFISGLELLLFFFFRRNSWICGSSHKGD